MEKLDFVCGSVLSEYEGTGNEKDRKLLNSIYVQEKNWAFPITFFYKHNVYKNTEAQISKKLLYSA